MDHRKYWTDETLSVLDVLADKPTEEDIDLTVHLFKIFQDAMLELPLASIIIGFAWASEELHNQVEDICMAVHEQAMKDILGDDDE